MRIEVAPASREDMRNGAAFEHDWISNTGWMPKLHSLAEIQDHYANTVFPKRTCLAAKHGSELLGVTALEPETHFIELLYVKADKRNRGVGAALLTEAQQGLNPHAQLWTFQKNLNAHRFYHRHGFSEVCRTNGEANDEKLPDILMEWRAP